MTLTASRRLALAFRSLPHDDADRLMGLLINRNDPLGAFLRRQRAELDALAAACGVRVIVRGRTMKFQRIWAMPSADTFDVPPIGDFVKRYLRESKVSIDPFARNKRWATHTNDLNPNTAATDHLDAAEYLEAMVRIGTRADLVIFYPPYSPRQVKELYDSIGMKMGTEDAWLSAAWSTARNHINNLVEIGGVVLSFGWNTIGMGRPRGYAIEEIMLVCHGAAHNDTICMAERKLAHQSEMALA